MIYSLREIDRDSRLQIPKQPVPQTPSVVGIVGRGSRLIQTAAPNVHIQARGIVADHSDQDDRSEQEHTHHDQQQGAIVTDHRGQNPGWNSG
jgi:hypothetical protein